MRDVLRPSSRPLGAARSAICSSACAFRKRSATRQSRSRRCSFRPVILRTRLRSLIPRLQYEAAIPFGYAPLIRNQRERLFAGIEHRGLNRGGDKVFDESLADQTRALSLAGRRRKPM